MKSIFLRPALLSAVLLFLAACSSDKTRLNNARFEIEQGNIRSAVKILSQIPRTSSCRAEADSILKTIEDK